MAQITLQPAGLIAALGLRDMGGTPAELANVVAPTVEVLDLYLGGRRETIQTTGIAAVVGANLFPTGIVPPAELWYVWTYTVAATAGAAAAIDFAAAINVDGQFTHPLSDYVIVNATENGRPGSQFGRPFVLFPGSNLGFLARQVVGAVTVQGAALITRLRV